MKTEKKLKDRAIVTEVTKLDSKTSPQVEEKVKVIVTAVPVKEQTAGTTSIADKVKAFYLQHNPSKLDEIPKLLEKYKGQEQELLRKLEKKYGVVTPIIVGGFTSPLPPDKSDSVSTPIDITKSGWGNNVFPTPSAVTVGSPSSLFGGQGAAGGTTTPTPFAVPSTGPLWGSNPVTPGVGGGTTTPTAFAVPSTGPLWGSNPVTPGLRPPSGNLNVPSSGGKSCVFFAYLKPLFLI